MKITKRQASAFARIHIAIHASYFDANGFDSETIPNAPELTDEQKEQLVTAVHSLAERIAKGNPMDLGHNFEILKYVQENY